MFNNKFNLNIINLDKYPYNFRNSFIVKNDKLIEEIITLYSQNPYAQIILQSKDFGKAKIIFNNYFENQTIIYLCAINLDTNYLFLKDNYSSFKEIGNIDIDKTKYITRNLKCSKNNIIFILDLNSNEIIYIFRDEYQNLVGHALDYFKAVQQEQGDKLKEIENKINEQQIV